MTAKQYNDKHYPVFVPHPTNHPLVDLSEQPSVQGVKYLQDVLCLKQDGYFGPATTQALAVSEAVRKGKDGLYIGPFYKESPVPTVTFEDDFRLGDTTTRTRRQKPTQIVIHYDVAWNARAAESILQKRGFSTHFAIDGDREGTIYQLHNPATKTCIHAGAVNDYSIGIDLNNPADPKYAERDEQKRGRARGSSWEKIHGYRVNRLNYFPEQIDSLVWLLKMLCAEFEIPMEVPRNPDETPIMGKFSGARNFNGILGHYHLSTRKTDPSPLDWDEVQERLFDQR